MTCAWVHICALSIPVLQELKEKLSSSRHETDSIQKCKESLNEVVVCLFVQTCRVECKSLESGTAF